ncbi:hypothetical protein CEXT_578691 [Caerostris extrusa]|uniref:Uncharacterized protein n=1 Tax=Caerostris extrusa TaxID=172846 RepID=A0AAV4MTC5_CAEEX|nr:hypothetical protein CEXT_578691 [Caerostris extrusa]
MGNRKSDNNTSTLSGRPYFSDAPARRHHVPSLPSHLGAVYLLLINASQTAELAFCFALPLSIYFAMDASS